MNVFYISCGPTNVIELTYGNQFCILQHEKDEIMKFLVIVLSGILIANCTPIIYGKYFYSKR